MTVEQLLYLLAQQRSKCFLNAVDTKALGTTHGTLDTEATNVGTTDLEVLADFTGATGDGTSGVASLTVMYIQNNNLS